MDAAALKDNGFESAAAYNGMRSGLLVGSTERAVGAVLQEPSSSSAITAILDPADSFQELYLTGSRSGGHHAPGLVSGRRIDSTASLPTLFRCSASWACLTNTGIGRDRRPGRRLRFLGRRQRGARRRSICA
jgi:hypothetical protein